MFYVKKFENWGCLGAPGDPLEKTTTDPGGVVLKSGFPVIFRGGRARE